MNEELQKRVARILEIRDWPGLLRNEAIEMAEIIEALNDELVKIGNKEAEK